MIAKLLARFYFGRVRREPGPHELERQRFSADGERGEGIAPLAAIFGSPQGSWPPSLFRFSGL